MKFAAVYPATLNAPPFSDASPAALGAWVRLAAAAAVAESDELLLTPTSSERTFLLGAGVTLAEVQVAVQAGLCRWVDGGLFVEGYDYRGQKRVESMRSNGAKSGGRPKKPTESKGKNLPVNQPGNRTETQAKAPTLPLPSLPFQTKPNPEIRIREEHATETGRASPVQQTLLSVQSGDPRTPKVPRPRRAALTPAGEPGVREVIGWFCDAWKEANGGARYCLLPRDAGQAKAMVSGLPAALMAELPVMFQRYMRDRDPFVEKQGRSLAFFCTSGGVNKYRSERPAGQHANGHVKATSDKVFVTGRVAV